MRNSSTRSSPKPAITACNCEAFVFNADSRNATPARIAKGRTLRSDSRQLTKYASGNKHSNAQPGNRRARLGRHWRIQRSRHSARVVCCSVSCQRNIAVPAGTATEASRNRQSASNGAVSGNLAKSKRGVVPAMAASPNFRLSLYTPEKSRGI